MAGICDIDLIVEFYLTIEEHFFNLFFQTFQPLFFLRRKIQNHSFGYAGRVTHLLMQSGRVSHRLMLTAGMFHA